MQHPHSKYYFVRSRSDQHRQHHQRNTNTISPNSNEGRNRVSFQLTPTLRVDRRHPRDMTPLPLSPPPSSHRRRRHTSSSSPRHHRDHGDSDGHPAASHGDQRSHHYRPIFTTAAEELLDALRTAHKLCAELLKVHKRDTATLAQFAGRRVLDVVWCARVGEVGGVDGEDGKKGESERQKLGGVLEKVETALAGVAKAKIRVVGEDDGGDVEKRLMEKVKGTREIFPGLVDVALREVGGMRDLAAEMELLEAMLKSGLKK